MNWLARRNVLNQYLRNTSIGTVDSKFFRISGCLYSHARAYADARANHAT
jgi:hypothetical protein